MSVTFLIRWKIPI